MEEPGGDPGRSGEFVIVPSVVRLRILRLRPWVGGANRGLLQPGTLRKPPSWLILGGGRGQGWLHPSRGEAQIVEEVVCGLRLKPGTRVMGGTTVGDMKGEGFTRREFLKAGSVGLTMAAAAPNWLAAGQHSGSSLEYRVLGRTGLRVTTVSMGCGQNSAEEVLAAAVDRGVNWLDTGHSYKNGQSEQEIGRLLRGRSEKPYVSTKLRTVPVETMRSQIDLSLRRLQMDTVDCLMIHDVRSRADVLRESNMELLEETRAAGKTRFFGFSTHRNMAECVDAAVESGFYDVVLTSFNFTVGQAALVEAVARAHAAGIGVIAMKTQLGNFPDPAGGLTPHQASLKWVLEHEGIACAVPAMRDFRELDQNLAVMTQRLSYREGRALEAYAVATASLRCRDCGACESTCPHGVDIRDVRRCAMYLEGYRDPALARESYGRIAANAAPCADCRNCTVQCPTGTELQPLLRRVHASLA